MCAARVDGARARQICDPRSIGEHGGKYESGWIFRNPAKCSANGARPFCSWKLVPRKRPKKVQTRSQRGQQTRSASRPATRAASSQSARGALFDHCLTPWVLVAFPTVAKFMTLKPLDTMPKKAAMRRSSCSAGSRGYVVAEHHVDHVEPFLDSIFGLLPSVQTSRKMLPDHLRSICRARFRHSEHSPKTFFRPCSSMRGPICIGLAGTVVGRRGLQKSCTSWERSARRPAKSGPKTCRGQLTCVFAPGFRTKYGLAQFQATETQE